MPEKLCWNCGETFSYDEKDIRPFIFHNCKNGAMAGTRNPNFWEAHRRSFRILKHKKTSWIDFK